jgi:hypothetical protein
LCLQKRRLRLDFNLRLGYVAGRAEDLTAARRFNRFRKISETNLSSDEFSTCD